MRTLKQVATNMADAFTRFGLWKGGGSGGNGQVTYGGIDTSNVIYELTSSVEGTEWVATEDCYFIGTLVGGNNKASTFYIDDVVVGSQYSSSTIITANFPILLLKGQKVKCKAMDSNYIRTVKFYGVKKSENILDEYSTEEKVVGKWIDGKPIYEKVINGTMIGSPANWADFYDCANLNIDNMICIKGFFNYDNERNIYIDSRYSSFSYVYNTKFIQYYNTELTQHNFETTLIIQYTKTTD